MGGLLDADELLVEALVTEGEGVVVQAEEVQDGRVQVADWCTGSFVML